MNRENQLVRAGTYLFGFGALAFLPSLTGHELAILSWLGAWEVPIGISSMVVGAALWLAGKVQDVRSTSPGVPDASPVGSPDVTAASIRAGEPARGSQSMPVVQPNVLRGQAPISPDPKRSR